MNNKYEQEITDFQKNFGKYREKRVVLYGIGRYTATLISGISGFNIVGLMDKDPANIGKEYFGLPVLSSDEAKSTADLIVINTAGTYWYLIYERIKNIGVPVFFRNGERATAHQKIDTNSDYWKSSAVQLQRKIKGAEVISFDFYDTLFSRAVCNPKDLVTILDVFLKTLFSKCNINYEESRANVLKDLSENYTFDELYDAIAKEKHIDRECIKKIKKLEIDFEERFLVPREAVISCMKKAVEHGKEIYIISDMYLPVNFFRNVLEKKGINIEPDHILISGELRRSKSDGTLWEYYKSLVKRKLLHIGDNLVSDVENAKEKGIDSFYVASAWDILGMSSMRGIKKNVCSLWSSMIMGQIIGKIFSNPFALNKHNGKVRICTDEELGFYVFGPVILAFFQWLVRRVREDKVSRLVFMARDGFFLKDDFDAYLKLRHENIETCYVGISRQLAMTASAETECDIDRLIHMPYTGSVRELLEDRFDIKEAEINENNEIPKYMSQIKDKVNSVRQKYKKYVENFSFSNSDALVDIGYYGNNQRYLNKIAEVRMRGYYFNADCSKENENNAFQSMTPCFQMKNDARGKESGVLKHQIYLESFLTAPYGMIRDIGDDGDFICAPKRKNQEYFDDKARINDGVMKFVEEFERLFGYIDIEEDIEFVNDYYRECFEGGVEFSDEVKRSFYNDNAMMHRMESNLFE